MQVFRSTLAPGEVIVRLCDSGRGLETPLDDAMNLALDILETAYKIRGGERVPVVVDGTDRVTASPRYRPVARGYSVVEPRFREVSVHLGRSPGGLVPRRKPEMVLRALRPTFPAPQPPPAPLMR